MKNKHIPEVRFARFTGDWEQRTLGEMSESFEYGLNASATEYDGENKYIRITDIDDNTHEFLEENLTSPNIDLSSAENYLVKEGDILFARTGASVGKSYIYDKKDGKVYYAGFLIRARIKSGYDPEFIFQNTLTSKYSKFIKVTSQRSGQPGVNAQEYANFSLMAPNNDEQTKIGKFFKQLDDTIALQQQELTALKQTKQGFLQKMFPKEGESVPEVRFPGFTDAWEQRKLGEIATLSSSKRIHLSDYVTNGIPFYRGSEISTGGITGRQELFISENLYQEIKEKYGVPQENDLLVTAVGTIGNIWKVDKRKFYYKDGNLIQISKLKSNPDYILSYFNDGIGKRRMLDSAAGSNQKALTMVKMREITLPLPKEDEQIQIGMFFKNLDHLITLHQRELDALKETKKAFLQKMFVYVI